MKSDRGLVAAAALLVVCCAGPALLGVGVMAAVTGFIARSWYLLAIVPVVLAIALLGHHRSKSTSSKDPELRQ